MKVIAKVGIKQVEGYDYFIDDSGDVSRRKIDHDRIEKVAKVGIIKEPDKEYIITDRGDIGIVEKENIFSEKKVSPEFKYSNQSSEGKVCLSSVGIVVAIVWLIADYESFFGALILFIIIYSIYKYRREKRVKKQREEEEKREQDRLKKEREFEKKQNAKGLYKFENKWGTKEQIEKWKEYKYGISQNFMNMSPFQFEEFIAKLFRKMGYDAHATNKTGDYGIDVIAKKDGKKIAIQCKQNQIGNNVGNVTIQNTLGSMWKIKAEKSIIITTSDFTTKAEEQAKEAPIELWDGRYLKKLVRRYFIESNDDKTKKFKIN